MADGTGSGLRSTASASLLGLMVNPADRLWRYPIGHAVVGLALRTPLTPNHVTIGHTLLGISAGVLISTGRPEMLVAAGVMYEVRSTLDCFDGVLARARGTSSPYGRAMDQTGDFLGFASFVAGSWAAFTRTMGFTRAMVLCLVTSALCALCTLCWDFYKRRFTSIIVDGRDEVADEYVKLQLEARRHPGFAFGFSAWLARVQALAISPSMLPALRARVASGQERSADAPEHPAVGPLREMAERGDPQLRATLLKVGFSGGDTGILILTVGALVTRPVEGFLAASAYCVVILAATISASNRLLHAQPKTDSPH
jgi:phosphatidylglycerophosphate synthase